MLCTVCVLLSPLVFVYTYSVERSITLVNKCLLWLLFLGYLFLPVEYEWFWISPIDWLRKSNFYFLMCLLNVKEPRDQQCGLVLSFFFLIWHHNDFINFLSVFSYWTNKSCNSILLVVCIFNYCIVIVNISHNKISSMMPFYLVVWSLASPWW